MKRKNDYPFENETFCESIEETLLWNGYSTDSLPGFIQSDTRGRRLVYVSGKTALLCTLLFAIATYIWGNTFDFQTNNYKTVFILYGAFILYFIQYRDRSLDMTAYYKIYKDFVLFSFQHGVINDHRIVEKVPISMIQRLHLVEFKNGTGSIMLIPKKQNKQQINPESNEVDGSICTLAHLKDYKEVMILLKGLIKEVQGASNLKK